jgi:hypothetical protein
VVAMKRLILICVLCGLLLPSAYGETISHTFSDGAKYVGEVMNGRQHGQDTHTSADGDKYVGEWKETIFGQARHTTRTVMSLLPIQMVSRNLPTNARHL